MNKFIKKLLLFVILISSVISGALFYFYNIGGNDLPAPNFSNSISFNEKIDFLKNKDLTRIEYAVIGSSMSLNNINSETMVKYLGENYINLASWGFKISESENYLKNMIGFFPNLKTVIISTSFMDFSSSSRNIDAGYNMIKNSIKYNLNYLAYLWSFDLKYMYNNSKENKAKKQIRNSYQNLVYDKYGGAILDIDKKNVNPERWNNNILNYDVSENELTNLEQLIIFLNGKGIGCVIAVPPQREGLLNDENMQKINTEIEKIKNIVVRNKGIFVDSFELGSWNDSLFVDYTHLNRSGAEKYTQLILEKLTSRRIEPAK